MPPVSSCPDEGRSGRLRVGVVVPTVHGGAALLRVARLPKGTGSVLSAIGDFRPLPGSSRCADLTADTGPIGRVTGSAPGSFDFGFDRPPDADRSWEAAIVFAVLALRSEGVDLVEPASAEIVAVVYGSVDADLDLGLDGLDARDRTSTARWTAVLADPTRRIARIGAAMRSEAGDLDDGAGASVRRLDAETVARVLRPARAEPAGRRIRSPAIAIAIAIAVVFAVAVAAAFAGLRLRTSEADLPPQPAVSSATSPTAPSAGAEARPVERPVDRSEPGEGDAFRVRLLVAPQGRRCEEVVFGAVEPVVVTVPSSSTAVLDLAERSDVCGIDVASTVAERRIDLRLSPSLRPGTIEHATETIDGKTFARLRLYFGRGLRRSAGFDVVAATSDGEPTATLAVRPPKR